MVLKGFISERVQASRRHVNAASSAGVSRETASSISFTPLTAFSLQYSVDGAQLALHFGLPAISIRGQIARPKSALAS